MVRWLSVLCVGLLVCGLSVSDVSAKGKGKGKGKKGNAPVISQEIENEFKQLDKDGNGQLSLDEFKAGKPDAQAAEVEFKAIDKDGDGSISLNEFAASKAPAKVKRGGKRHNKG